MNKQTSIVTGGAGFIGSHLTERLLQERHKVIILDTFSSGKLENIRKRDVLVCLHHYNLISKYIQSVKDDSDPPVKPEEGRKTIRLLECIEESLKKNQRVKM